METDKLEDIEISINLSPNSVASNYTSLTKMYDIMQITQRDVMTVFTVIPQSNAKHLAIKSD